MKRFFLLVLALQLPAQALSPVRAEWPLGTLKSCTVTESAGPHKGQSWHLTMQGAHVRFAQYGHRYPDNTLRVRQSYSRAGKLTGLSVTVTGFAGTLLQVRTAVNAQGQLLPEQGFRRAGFVTPLKSYLRPVPSAVSRVCTSGSMAG